MNDTKFSNTNKWVFHEAKPSTNGRYLARMNEDDDEPMSVEIKDGDAIVDGSARIFINHEWQLVSLSSVDIELMKNMATMQERAKYLLNFEITTSVQIVDLQPVLKAFIDEIGLPIHSEGTETSDDVIAKAKAWLEQQAA